MLDRNQSEGRPEPRFLFVDHVAALGGAELAMAELIRELPNATLCLFADGPLADRLRAEARQVIVVSDKDTLGDIRRGSSLASAFARSSSILLLIIRLFRISKSYQVVVANSQKAFVISALACALSRRPLVWWLHDLLTDGEFGLGLRKLVVVLSNHFATRVLTVSEAGRQAYVAAGGRASKVAVVYNPVSVPKQPQSSSVRDELGLQDAFLVGHFSRISRWKGQHVLIQALSHIQDAHAVVVGSALFGEDDYERELKELVQDLNLKDRVHFLGFRSDIGELMGAMDVVVHSSVLPEPFGRVLVEAMLVGTPIIATSGGGTKEIIDDRESGLLVEPGRSDLLADAIMLIRSDANLRNNLTANGRVRAQERFSPLIFIARFKAAIKGVGVGAPTSYKVSA